MILNAADATRLMLFPDSQRNSTCQTQSSWIRFIWNGRPRTSARVRYKNTLAYLFAGLRKYLSTEAVKPHRNTLKINFPFSLCFTHMHHKPQILNSTAKETVFGLFNKYIHNIKSDHSIYSIPRMVSQLSLCHPTDFLLRLSTA